MNTDNLQGHTPGKWDNNLHDGNVYCGGMVVANCYSSFLSPATIKANAALCAAAPQLLEENKSLKKMLHDLTPGGSEFYNDPQKCFDWIKESRESAHYAAAEAIKATKGENETLKGQVKQLREALSVAQEACLSQNVFLSIYEWDRMKKALENTNPVL